MNVRCMWLLALHTGFALAYSFLSCCASGRLLRHLIRHFLGRVSSLFVFEPQ